MKRSYVQRNWSLQQRLAHYSALEASTGCILWTGALGTDGYGQLWWQGRLVRVHRLAWELVSGPIPEGKHVCHHCDAPTCINFDHLFLGTHADNMADRSRKDRHRATRGSANGNAKLTVAKIVEIRSAIETTAQLARNYFVGESAIRQVRARKTWRHVP